MSPKEIVIFLWVFILGVAWVEARPKSEVKIYVFVKSSKKLDLINNTNELPWMTTATPARNLTLGEDFPDDISTSLTSTTEDSYTEETSLNVTSTTENSYSEVTSPSTTPSDEEFYSEESALSSTLTPTEQSTSKKDEPTAKSIRIELVIVGCVGVITPLLILVAAFVIKKCCFSRILSSNLPKAVNQANTEL